MSNLFPCPPDMFKGWQPISYKVCQYHPFAVTKNLLHSACIHAFWKNMIQHLNVSVEWKNGWYYGFMKIDTGWCIWWSDDWHCQQCLGISIPTEESINSFPGSLNMNIEQFPERTKILMNLAKIFAWYFLLEEDGGSFSIIAPVCCAALPHEPSLTHQCLSILALGQLHHIFKFIMKNHSEMLSYF